jgi:hypothetical protein
MDAGIGLRESLDVERVRALGAELQGALEGEGFLRATEDEDDELPVAFKRTNADGDVLETVHVHDDHIHVLAHEYRGWEFTRDQVVKRLAPALSLARSELCEPAGLMLVFRDRFITDKPEEYDPYEVFKPNDFLPAAVFNHGALWTHQLALNFPVGQEDRPRLYSRLSVNAGVESVDENDEKFEHSTDITHRQLMFRNREADVNVEWSEEQVKFRLDAMHLRNKELMLELLSEEMSDRIGLRETTDE